MSKCPEGLVYGDKLTSEWRSKNLGKAAGGGETSKAEHYQRKAVEDGTGLECPKSDGTRINFRKNKLEKNNESAGNFMRLTGIEEGGIIHQVLGVDSDADNLSKLRYILEQVIRLSS